MRKVLVCTLLSAILALLLSCASGSTAKWKASDVNSSLKGQTEEQIIARFGQPDRRSGDSRKMVFEYKKPTEGQNSGINTVTKVSTFGLYQTDSFVDMMRLTFRNGKVVDYAYDENVVGFAALPGNSMTGQSVEGEESTTSHKKGVNKRTTKKRTATKK